MTTVQDAVPFSNEYWKKGDLSRILDFHVAIYGPHNNFCQSIITVFENAAMITSSFIRDNTDVCLELISDGLEKYGLMKVSYCKKWLICGIFRNEETLIHPIHFSTASPKWIQAISYNNNLIRSQVVKIHEQQITRFKFMKHELDSYIDILDLVHLVLHYLFSSVFFPG